MNQCRRHRGTALVPVIGAGLGLALHASLCGAALVTTCADDPNDAGSLRSILKNATNNETVDLSQLNCSVITLAHPSIPIGPINVTLLGPQPPKSLTISGNGQYRVLTHSVSFAFNSATLTIDHLTIAQGKYASNGSHVRGGCIYSYSNVTLSNSTVTGCTVRENADGLTQPIGGGIYAIGTVSLVNSTVSGNLAWSQADGQAARGGGIVANEVNLSYSTVTANSAIVSSGAYGYGGAIEADNVTVTASTIDNNTADVGAGFVLFGDSSKPSAHSTMTNSTVASNKATLGAGGIALTFMASMQLLNSTVAFNQSVSGIGGLATEFGTPLTMYSTIIAENSTTSGAAADLGIGGSIAGSHNLVMHPNYFPPGLIATTANPRLVRLGNHGGITRTCALQSFSAALEQGYLSTFLFDDQRGIGYDRSVGFGPDIGAYERQDLDDELFADSFDY